MASWRQDTEDLILSLLSFLRWLFETRLSSVKADTFSGMVNISRMWVTFDLEASFVPSEVLAGFFCSKFPPMEVISSSFISMVFLLYRNAGYRTTLGFLEMIEVFPPRLWGVWWFYSHSWGWSLWVEVKYTVWALIPGCWLQHLRPSHAWRRRRSFFFFFA